MQTLAQRRRMEADQASAPSPEVGEAFPPMKDHRAVIFHDGRSYVRKK